MARLQIRRGTKSALPSSGMLEGELLVTTDKHTLHVATGATTQVPVVPDIVGLSSIDAVDLTADYLIVHDSSTALEKRVLGSDFKTALSIPAGSTDEKCSVNSGGTAGYLWNTDGTDGILRMNTSMSMTKDSGNAYVTLAVGTIDLGAF